MTIVREPASISTLGASSQTLVVDVLRAGSNGVWELRLPARLAPHQAELETLISKVFADRPHSAANLELAQQMTLNWCRSKCRKLGINLEDSLKL